jgi:hypothetical protein
MTKAKAAGVPPGTPAQKLVRDWAARIDAASDIGPSLDPHSAFCTVARKNTLIVVRHSEKYPGHYRIERYRVSRNPEGDVIGLADEFVEEFRPVKQSAVGFWLQHFGCTRSDKWLRVALPAP